MSTEPGTPTTGYTVAATVVATTLSILDRRTVAVGVEFDVDGAGPWVYPNTVYMRFWEPPTLLRGIAEVFLVAGVTDWERVRGAHIRVKMDDQLKILAIGHAIEDSWVSGEGSVRIGFAAPERK